MISQRLKLFLMFFSVQMIILAIVYYTYQKHKNIDVVDFKEKSKRKSLFEIGMKHQTDKVNLHHYETLYEKYLTRYRDTSVRVLEIGLGCGTSRGAGASAQTWREYLGYKADLHYLEIDKKCGENWESTIGKQVTAKIMIFIVKEKQISSMFTKESLSVETYFYPI